MEQLKRKRKDLSPRAQRESAEDTAKRNPRAQSRVTVLGRKGAVIKASATGGD